MKGWTILALLLWLAPVAARAADPLPALFDVSGVSEDDVLNIRAAPDPKADKIGKLAHDATGVEVTGFGPTGHWARVNTGEQTGWVALRYLAPVETPGWSTGAAPLTCFGTEPFWALRLDPAKKTALFERPEAKPVTLTIARLMTAARGFPPLVEAGLEDGGRPASATITGGDCSDGMSDMSYGLSVEFMHQPEGAPPLTLTGCCSLAR